DPTIYAESDLLPSLGDLLLNVLAFTWIVVFIFVHRKEYVLPEWLRLRKWAAYILLVGFALTIGGIGFLAEDIFFGLVYYSKIEFNISNIINLSWVSWLSIFILCLVWLQVYLLVKVFAELSSQLVQISLREKIVL